jgi:hypothetical protein
VKSASQQQQKIYLRKIPINTSAGMQHFEELIKNNIVFQHPFAFGIIHWVFFYHL